ncbi:hypothetical protein BH18ACT11_BH18ACT11_00330 [soil metagenome]
MEREQGAVAGKTLVGRAFSIVAIIFCVPVGVLFVSVATGAVGICLGVVGYVLGARRLASVAVALSVVAMFLGLLVGQGALPGSYDAALDGAKEMLRGPFSDR